MPKTVSNGLLLFIHFAKNTLPVIKTCHHNPLPAYYSRPLFWSTLNRYAMQFFKLLSAMAMVLGVTMAAPVKEPAMNEVEKRQV